MSTTKGSYPSARMFWPPTLHFAVTPFRLTLAIALMAVASSGYVVFVAAPGPPSSVEMALAFWPQPCACREPNVRQRGRISFATAIR